MDLREKYDEIYKNGSDEFFTFGHFNFEEAGMILSMMPSLNGLKVLEIGCGEGELSAMIAMAGAKEVIAMDSSLAAIEIAEKRFNMPNLTYRKVNFTILPATQNYDVVVMQGLLEHLDEPWVKLASIKNDLLKDEPGACIITTSPGFLNPRGYIWMTLQLLFDMPMSLTDKHFFFREDFLNFAQDHNLEIEQKECDYDWGNHEKMIIDLQRRLPKVFHDKPLYSAEGVQYIPDFDLLLKWLGRAHRHLEKHPVGSGATMGFKLSRK